MRNGIKIENVKPAEIQPYQSFKVGTAEVTIGGQMRTLKAVIYEDHVTVQGVAVRNGQGLKQWRGELTLWHKSGNISAIRTGNFRNPHGNGVTVVGFYDAAKNICQHSSQYTA